MTKLTKEEIKELETLIMETVNDAVAVVSADEAGVMYLSDGSGNKLQEWLKVHTLQQVRCDNQGNPLSLEGGLDHPSQETGHW